jgi:uncharacterized protein
MKKISFPIALIFLFSSLLTNGQVNRFIGTWQGILNVGVELRAVFHIKEDGKQGLVATTDSPDQSVYGMKCDSVIVANNTIRIVMTALQANYTGELTNDSTINGALFQQVSFPLVLKKTDKTDIKAKVRPQTPKPPFPYKSEDVQYSNADKSLSFGATITIPEGKGPFPAIMLITGSGAQDRDETILDHKPFAVIADHLTRKGFIVLRADERGVGKSTGDFSSATSEDFANDISSGLDYLLTRPEVDKKKVGLIGHSEGGMIAPMLAVKRKDLDFIVLMAGPGVRIVNLMAEQHEAIARSAGVSDSALKLVKPFFRMTVNGIMNHTDSIEILMMTENWAKQKSKEVLTELNLETWQARNAYIHSMYQLFKSPWYNYFMNFHPQPWLEQLECKVLAINGDKDIQVLSSQNLAGIEVALKRTKAKFEIKELKGLNHLFQTCKKCTVQEYGELEETIAPIALETISAWLEKNVK